jgi:hypothetical protein
MKLYLVKRTDATDYDEYDAIVVRAQSEERAAAIATGNYVGMAPHNIEVTEVPVDGDEDVILDSFNAG